MEAGQRGPDYDWKREAEHFRSELEKTRALLGVVEGSSERYAYALERIRAEATDNLVAAIADDALATKRVVLSGA